MSQAILNGANLSIGIVVSVLVARMVLATGRAMLSEAFPHNGALAGLVARLAVTSFSLICCGYLGMELGIFWTQPNSGVPTAEVWDTASIRLEIASLGWLAVFLGVNLFFHLLVLSQVRGRGRRRPNHGDSILA